jgi:hypothetical protein
MATINNAMDYATNDPLPPLENRPPTQLVVRTKDFAKKPGTPPPPPANDEPKQHAKAAEGNGHDTDAGANTGDEAYRSHGDAPDADEFADETDSAETDDEAAARASALRAILIDGLDANRIEWRIKRQWPRLRDIPGIIASAQRTAEKWKPGTKRVIGGMQKRITSVDLLNECFVMITVPVPFPGGS